MLISSTAANASFATSRSLAPGKNRRGCAGILAEDLRKAGEGLLAELDARQILDANDLRRLAANALDDDVLEFFYVGKPTERIDGELEGLVGWNRRAAQLSATTSTFCDWIARCTSSVVSP